MVWRVESDGIWVEFSGSGVVFGGKGFVGFGFESDSLRGVSRFNILYFKYMYVWYGGYVDVYWERRRKRRWDIYLFVNILLLKFWEMWFLLVIVGFREIICYIYVLCFWNFFVWCVYNE